MYGNGDAVIGINPATDNLHNLSELASKLLDHVIQEYQIPTTIPRTHPYQLRYSTGSKKCAD
ncbi:ethanolamine ammonia-lyase subunit EutB [Acinetobacter baumannii]